MTPAAKLLVPAVDFIISPLTVRLPDAATLPVKVDVPVTATVPAIVILPSNCPPSRGEGPASNLTFHRARRSRPSPASRCGPRSPRFPAFCLLLITKKGFAGDHWRFDATSCAELVRRCCLVIPLKKPCTGYALTVSEYSAKLLLHCSLIFPKNFRDLNFPPKVN